MRARRRDEAATIGALALALVGLGLIALAGGSAPASACDTCSDGGGPDGGSSGSGGDGGTGRGDASQPPSGFGPPTVVIPGISSGTAPSDDSLEGATRAVVSRVKGVSAKAPASVTYRSHDIMSWRDTSNLGEIEQYKVWVTRNTADRPPDEVLSEDEIHKRNAQLVQNWLTLAVLTGKGAGVVLAIYAVAVAVVPAATLAVVVAAPAPGYVIAGAVAGVPEAIAAAKEALDAAQDPSGRSRK